MVFQHVTREAADQSEGRPRHRRNHRPPTAGPRAAHVHHRRCSPAGVSLGEGRSSPVPSWAPAPSLPMAPLNPLLISFPRETGSTNQGPELSGSTFRFIRLCSAFQPSFRHAQHPQHPQPARRRSRREHRGRSGRPDARARSCFSESAVRQHRPPSPRPSPRAVFVPAPALLTSPRQRGFILEPLRHFPEEVRFSQSVRVCAQCKMTTEFRA